MNPTAVPRVRTGVRLSYDEVRETHVVLFPEGVLVLNDTAAAVITLCDGHTTITDITRKLSDDFDGVDQEDITDLLRRLITRRVVDLDG